MELHFPYAIDPREIAARLMPVIRGLISGDRHKVGHFDDQKAVTVRGTFLHNKEAMEEFRREDYNSIEMEAGPYLSAVRESSQGRGEKGSFEEGTNTGMIG